MLYDEQYKAILINIMRFGEKTNNRTGIDTRSRFGEMISIDLQVGFPMLQLRKLNIKHPAIELLWMLQGRHDVQWLHARGSHIWDKWADNLLNRGYNPGDLGRVYGAQWRTFGDPRSGSDQLKMVIHDIIKNPTSRRIIMSAWSPNELYEMALPPCHVMFQFSVRQGKRLDLLVTQRSMDFPVGGPHDIAQFALMVHLIAHVCQLIPGNLHISVGDLHIYENQIEACHKMIDRGCGNEPVQLAPLPSSLVCDRPLDFEDALEAVTTFDPQIFQLIGYNPAPAISIPVTA